MGLLSRLFTKKVEKPPVRQYYTDYAYYKVCGTCKWAESRTCFREVCPKCGDTREDATWQVGRLYIEETLGYAGRAISSKRTFVPRESNQNKETR